MFLKNGICYFSEKYLWTKLTEEDVIQLGIDLCNDSVIVKYITSDIKSKYICITNNSYKLGDFMFLKIFQCYFC